MTTNSAPDHDVNAPSGNALEAITSDERACVKHADIWLYSSMLDPVDVAEVVSIVSGLKHIVERLERENADLKRQLETKIDIVPPTAEQFGFIASVMWDSFGTPLIVVQIEQNAPEYINVHVDDLERWQPASKDGYRAAVRSNKQ